MMTTGEVRADMAAELGKSLEAVVNDMRRLPSYYILITVRWEGGDVLRTKIVTMLKKDVPQTPLVNSICYFVDNENGVFRQLWCLPMDPEIPEEGVQLLQGREVESVLESSRLLEVKIAGQMAKGTKH